MASLSLPSQIKTQHPCQIIISAPRIVVSVPRDYRNHSTYVYSIQYNTTSLGKKNQN
jgi:hypothetical protein